jgi:hypothetical protein
LRYDQKKGKALLFKIRKQAVFVWLPLIQFQAEVAALAVPGALPGVSGE